MASELETNIRTAYEKLANALANASELTVETRVKAVNADNPNDMNNGTLAAQTIIKLDGDQTLTIPVQANAPQITIETELLDLHMRNVQASIEYRASMLNALLNLLRRGTV